jgi:hypothetical protein
MGATVTSQEGVFFVPCHPEADFESLLPDLFLDLTEVEIAKCKWIMADEK